MKRVLLVLLSASLLGLGCGDDDSTKGSSGGKDGGAEPAAKPAAKKMIKAADGGKLSSSGAALDIPAGALSSDTEITLGTIAAADLPDTKNVASKGYDFGPNGTKFKKPVALTIDFDASKVPDGKSAVMAWLDHDKWMPLDDSSIDGDTVVASTTHFTTFAIVYVSNGDGGGMQTEGSCADDYDTSCGGNVVGTWDFSVGCVSLGANAFGGGDGGDPFGGCKGVKISASGDFSGTIVFNKDGTYANNLATMITVDISIPTSCLMGASCTDIFDGGVANGDACESQTVEKQDAKDETGTYTVDGKNMLMTMKDGDDSSDDNPIEYCIKGNTLTAKSTDPDKGTSVIFQATRK